jgi:hypothetical protein
VAERQPRLVTQEEIRAAVGKLEQRRAAGEISEADVARRINDCRRAVTPRDLWKASGHRTGSRERADKAEIRRSIRLQLAIVAFAIIIMMFVLLGTIINNQGGTVDTPIFPWEWGSSDN